MTELRTYNRLSGGLIAGTAVVTATLFFGAWQFHRLAVGVTAIHCSCGKIFSAHHPLAGAASTGVGLLGTIILTTLGFHLWQIIRRQQQQLAPLLAGRRPVWNQAIHQVVVVTPQIDPLAMTVGFWRPQVVVSQGTFQALDYSEVVSVLRHEAHHRAHFDPARSVLMEAIRRTFGWIGPVKTWVAAAYTYRELAADATATNNYQHSAGLAGALLKMSTSAFAPQAATFSPNQTRVDRLLHPHRAVPGRLWSGALTAGVVMIAVGVGLLAWGTSVWAVAPTTAIAHQCIEVQHICREAVLQQLQSLGHLPVMSVYVLP